VSRSHSSSNGDVVTGDLLVRVNDGDEPNVVGEDVDIVVRREGDGDLELKRQTEERRLQLLIKIVRIGKRR
jgi:hypothetical protein